MNEYPNDSTNKLRYVAYIRKSTEDEEKQVLSREAQKDKIRERYPQLNIVDYLEESRSAFKPHQRPVFESILAKLDSGEYEGIAGWHPDRCSRNEIEAAELTWRLRQGIIKDFKFANYMFDNSPEGIMMLQMTMSQSQYFSAKLSKDVKRGNEKKRRLGGITGVAPAGYSNNREDKTVYKDTKRWPLIRRAFDYYLTGNYSVQEILGLLNGEWGYRTPKRTKTIRLDTGVKVINRGGKTLSRTALYGIFRNVRYAGWIPETYDPNKLYKADFPAMLTQEEYDKVQMLLGKHGNNRLGTRKEFVLRGFIRCGECGCMITAETKKVKLASGMFNAHSYYHCTGKRKGCSQKSVYVKEDALYQECVELLDSYELIPELYEWGIEAIKDMLAKEVPDRKATETMQAEAITGTEDQLDRLLDLSTKGLIDEEQFKKKSQKLRAELKRLQGQRKAKDEATASWYDYMCHLVALLTDVNEKFVKGDIAGKKEILTTIGQNPVLLNGKLQVTPEDWLIPLQNDTKRIREEVLKVRMMSQQMKKNLLEALRLEWCT